MKELEKKCRIQLYDAEFNQLSDRLVNQEVEFRNGPKEVHKNPMRIELSLFTQTDVDEFLEYLKRVQGALPLDKPKGPRGRKPKGFIKPGSRDAMMDILKGLKEDEVIPELRKMGFVAISIPFMRDMGYTINLPKTFAKEDRWRFMVRLLKKAKNPLNSKYDPLIIVALRKNSYFIILDGETVHSTEFESEIASKVKVPAKAKTKFPEYLTLDERNQFRVDMGKLIDDPKAKPTRLYTRWVHVVAKMNSDKGIEFPRIDEILNPILSNE